MSKTRALVSLTASAVLFCSLSYAVSPDRITGDLNSGQIVTLQGNVHGFARPQFDLGRVDGNRIIEGVSLSFHPSAAQQADLNDLLAHLQDPASPRFHKFLTPAQFANRYGMSRNDIARVTEWLQSQGFTNISVANSRNLVSFNGTVAQVEAVFHTEIHEYLVHGETHFANSNEPSVPAAMAESILAIGHLHNFGPKPRLVRPRLTSYVTGNHYLTPDDFATIYDLNPLYSAGITGTGQSIAVVGQSTVNTSDLNNFRSAAGLPASTVTMTLIEGTATRCPGDEGESDLDLEWSGGVAKNASIIFVYAGLGQGDSCGSSTRVDTVWDALQYAVDQNVAPFISTSYGFCESGLGENFVEQLQGLAQQGQSQGQTIVGPAGDSGAADCDPNSTDPNDTVATGGLAVDAPASIPEVTGAGGSMFSADSATCTTNCHPPGGDPPYWAPAGATSDTLSSALEYIPESAWNETGVDGGGIAAGGGGASIYFSKPAWQTGTGVPNDGKRDVPDIALNTGYIHDPYLICSEDGASGAVVSTCTAGFRTGAGGNFTPVGGTSAAAPTFSAILALVNQFFGNVPPGGLAPINPILYGFAAIPPASGNPFHDITTGNNIVPCASGSPDCPASGSFGFSAGTGYDQATGLGSVDANLLAKGWLNTQPNLGMSGAPATVVAGHSTTTTVTVTAQNGFAGTVTFSCPSSGLPTGVTCTSFSPASVPGGSGSTTLTIQTLASIAPATTSVTVYGTSGSLTHPATVSVTASKTDQSFTLKASSASYSVSPGSSITATVTLTGTNGFNTPVTYACSDSASGSTCTGPSTAVNPSTPASFLITTQGPTAEIRRPDRATRVFYAALLPGLLGIFLIPGSRRRSLRGMHLLGLIMVLGCSTLWLASCGGSNGGTQSSGTPPGSYTITVNATTGGANPVTGSTTFALVVQ